MKRTRSIGHNQTRKQIVNKKPKIKIRKEKKRGGAGKKT